MASWNSIPLEITYEVLGWVAFLSWTVGAYPQIVLNFRRKSVVGLNFDFVVLNLTKQSAYLIYNASLYFSSAVQKQYFEKYGKEQMIPVAANDVAFSIHAVLMTAVTLCQIAIYERGNQKVSKISFGIVAAVWLGAAVCVFLALPTHSWLWLISIFNVVGLNFDFVVLNLTKHSSYLIYNASLYFSSAVQKQYFKKYGEKQMIPVAANDVAFSCHAVLLTAVTLYQIAIYERGNQKVSKISIGIVAVVWLAAAVCVFVALPRHSWLWLISVFNSIQVSMTCIKYIPQAVMNFLRKSTDGFSIGNILLDFTGGAASYAQMAMQSIDQHSWVNFYGNIGKTLLSLISIFFDLLFMCQHFVLYRGKSSEELVKTTDEPVSENV